MIEFPELQQALVHAASRRRRAPRFTRPLVVAVACAAIAAAVLTITHQPNDERAASPAPDPLSAYAVFKHAATAADGLPSSVDGMPGLGVEQARLAERSGPWRVYLVAGTLDGRPSLCAFAVIGDRARYGCDPAGTVHAYPFPEADGEPGGVIATVPDGVEKVEFGFPGETFTTPVENNLALARLSPWPQGAGTIGWTDSAGVHHEKPMKSPIP